MKSIRDNIASLSRLELTQRLQAAVGERPEVQQTVGDVLGPVVGRRVDTAEISDAEGEGLAELVGEASDTGYSRAVAEMARRAPAVTARVLVEAVARAEGSGDRAAREYARRGLETVGSRGVAGLVWTGVQRLPQVLARGLLDVPTRNAGIGYGSTSLAVWDSPVSLHAVLQDSKVTGELQDAQIVVSPQKTSMEEMSTGEWLPAGGNLRDMDSVHAFAAVRAVVDVFERILRLG
eukprot:m51a1_g13105 hypothetical protein (235) ;mRNA; f:1215-2812